MKNPGALEEDCNKRIENISKKFLHLIDHFTRFIRIKVIRIKIAKVIIDNVTEWIAASFGPKKFLDDNEGGFDNEDYS